MELASQMMAVFGVLALLLGLLWWSRKKGWAAITLPAMRTSSSKRILESVERLPLTAQHSLHLVRMGDRTLLIGVSPAGMTLLEGAAPIAPPPISGFENNTTATTT